MEEKKLKREGLEVVNSSEKQISGGYVPPYKDEPESESFLMRVISQIGDLLKPFILWNS